MFFAIIDSFHEPENDEPPMAFFWKQRTATWDRAMPVLGLILLFLEVSPRPVFGWDFESARVIAQFPLVALAFLAAWEKRFASAVVVASVLGLLQGSPGIRAMILHSTWTLEPAFPALAWLGMLLSYLHPSRRGVYFGGVAEPKEPQP